MLAPKGFFFPLTDSCSSPPSLVLVPCFYDLPPCLQKATSQPDLLLLEDGCCLFLSLPSSRSAGEILSLPGPWHVALLQFSISHRFSELPCLGRQRQPHGDLVGSSHLRERGMVCGIVSGSHWDYMLDEVKQQLSRSPPKPCLTALNLLQLKTGAI